MSDNLFLGWDPGANSCAFALIGDRDVIIATNTLHLDSHAQLASREEAMDLWLAATIACLNDEHDFEHRLRIVGIEDAYLGWQKNVKTTKRLSEARGAIRALLRHIIPGEFGIIDVPHATAKKMLTGSGVATKFGIQQAVLVRFCGSTDANETAADYGLTEHGCDAVAVAVVARDRWREEQWGKT